MSVAASEISAAAGQSLLRLCGSDSDSENKIFIIISSGDLVCTVSGAVVDSLLTTNWFPVCLDRLSSGKGETANNRSSSSLESGNLTGALARDINSFSEITSLHCISDTSHGNVYRNNSHKDIGLIDTKYKNKYLIMPDILQSCVQFTLFTAFPLLDNNLLKKRLIIV